MEREKEKKRPCLRLNYPSDGKCNDCIKNACRCCVHLLFVCMPTHPSRCIIRLVVVITLAFSPLTSLTRYDRYDKMCFMCGLEGHGAFQVVIIIIFIFYIGCFNYCIFHQTYPGGKLKGEFKCTKYRGYQTQLTSIKAGYPVTEEEIISLFKSGGPSKIPVNLTPVVPVSALSLPAPAPVPPTSAAFSSKGRLYILQSTCETEVLTWLFCFLFIHTKDILLFFYFI